jgi:hypothetical protein
VGYRSSLTEIIQIIGRATRDAPGKDTATFTNLIAEPDASEAAVVGAINDTLKAIAASLLMEQVLAPASPSHRRIWPPRTSITAVAISPVRTMSVSGRNRPAALRDQGLVEPKSTEAQRICQEDLNEVITQFVQNKTSLEQGLFNEETLPRGMTASHGQDRARPLPRIECGGSGGRAPACHRGPQSHAEAKAIAMGTVTDSPGEERANTALIDGIRQFSMDVRDLDIDLVDSINPFAEAYAILAKSMDEKVLKQVQSVISAKKVKISP